MGEVRIRERVRVNFGVSDGVRTKARVTVSVEGLGGLTVRLSLGLVLVLTV